MDDSVTLAAANAYTDRLAALGQQPTTTWSAIEAAVGAAVRAEREECARIAEAYGKSDLKDVADEIALAIRERSKP